MDLLQSIQDAFNGVETVAQSNEVVKSLFAKSANMTIKTAEAVQGVNDDLQGVKGEVQLLAEKFANGLPSSQGSQLYPLTPESHPHVLRLLQNSTDVSGESGKSATHFLHKSLKSEDVTYYKGHIQDANSFNNYKIDEISVTRLFFKDSPVFNMIGNDFTEVFEGDSRGGRKPSTNMLNVQIDGAIVEVWLGAEYQALTAKEHTAQTVKRVFLTAHELKDFKTAIQKVRFVHHSQYLKDINSDTNKSGIKDSSLMITPTCNKGDISHLDAYFSGANIKEVPVLEPAKV